jgi:hypothetical protein
MAPIAFNTARRAAERLETVLVAVGEKFDVFVGHPTRQAADEPKPPARRPLVRLALHLRRKATASFRQITSAVERCRKA